jgi:hypothetical protein
MDLTSSSEMSFASDEPDGAMDPNVHYKVSAATRRVDESREEGAAG